MSEFLCPHCGADLNEEGIGYDSHYYQVEYPDGSWSSPDYGDIITRYCPACGEEIDDHLANALTDSWYSRKEKK